MFFNGSFFWFLMGIVSVLVVAGFRAYAKDRGWTITIGNAILGFACYGAFLLSFYAWGTLVGENEGSAAIKILLFGLAVAVVLAVVLLRRLSLGSRKKLADPPA
jgi:hypothetical protein